MSDGLTDANRMMDYEFAVGGIRGHSLKLYKLLSKRTKNSEVQSQVDELKQGLVKALGEYERTRYWKEPSFDGVLSLLSSNDDVVLAVISAGLYCVFSVSPETLEVLSKTKLITLSEGDCVLIRTLKRE